ncbi:GNAT family N-acetyltransferase [Sporosarcina sp. FSL K6-3457]|uniref:GNAT family N-acetyltransferase n=1 Tax=Sporosarcina sp. FSL K6-3457 TaxID=2978204 RepID=UPI0030FB98D3
MEIRRLKADEFEQAIQLADQTFRDQEHTSMGQAFPHVFSTELGQSFGAFDGETLVSFMGLVPATLQIGSATLTVFSIGSVCTHENYRQQGISTKILQEIYRYTDQAAASLLFVSGDRGMYMRNDCYHFGKVSNYTISQTKCDYGGDISQAQSEDIFQIDSIRRATKVRFNSSIWEWRVLLEAGAFPSIFKMKQALYVASRDGVIEGYAVMGLPIASSTQQQAIVTEWGGDTKVVYEIFQNILAQGLMKEIGLTIPWHEKFCEELNQHPYEDQRNSGTIHIVNATRLLEQLLPYIYEKNIQVAQSLTIETLEDNHVILHYSGTKITLTPEDLVTLLFVPQENDLLGELQTVFPIPLPYTEGMYYV